MTWCTIPVAGGTICRLLERPLPPAQEFVALAIALELPDDILAQRVTIAEVVHLDRMIDHQIDRHDGVNLGGIASQPGHGGAHRRQIDDGRHAGEVLQDDPCRLEGNFRRCAGGAGDQLASAMTWSRVTT